MRSLNFGAIEKWRRRDKPILDHYGTLGNHKWGVFEVPSVTLDGTTLAIIATTGDGWDHVSVSRADHPPSWQEMEAVKRLFFDAEECCFQLHPPLDDYIDGSFPGGRAKNTLHIWRPIRSEIPRPPSYMVGGVPAEVATLHRKQHLEAERVKAGKTRAGLVTLLVALQGAAEFAVKELAQTEAPAVRAEIETRLLSIRGGVDYLRRVIDGGDKREGSAGGE